MDSRNDAADATPARTCDSLTGTRTPGATPPSSFDWESVESEALTGYIRRLDETRAALHEEIARFQARFIFADAAVEGTAQRSAGGLEDDLAVRFAQIQSFNAALLRIGEEIATLGLEARALASNRKELSRARDSLHESQATAQRLEGSLRRRFEELATLTAMLADREAELEDASLELWRERERTRRIERSFSWRILAPVRYCADLAVNLARGRRALASDVALIEASDMFNAVWYLRNNPDVAATGMDPAVHYLRYGASEGRNPGPGFDTDWYRESNPEIDVEVVNPLVHYLRHGRYEGRTPRR